MVLQDSLLVTLVQLVDRLPMPTSPVKRGRGHPLVYTDRLFLKALVIWQAQNAFWEWIGCLALVAMGRALFQAPNKSAVLGTAPGEYQGSASTLLATARQMGSSAVRKRDLTRIRYIVYSR